MSRPHFLQPGAYYPGTNRISRPVRSCPNTPGAPVTVNPHFLNEKWPIFNKVTGEVREEWPVDAKEFVKGENSPWTLGRTIFNVATGEAVEVPTYSDALELVAKGTHSLTGNVYNKETGDPLMVSHFDGQKLVLAGTHTWSE